MKIPMKQLRKWFRAGVGSEALARIAGRQRAIKAMRVGFDPEHSRSGGLIDNTEVEVMDARFTTEPPPDYRTCEATLFCRLTLRALTETETVECFWSMGSDALKFAPSMCGFGLINMTGGPKQLLKGSNFYHLMMSLRRHGYPTKWCASLRHMIGMRMHMVRMCVRSAMPAENRMPSILVCSHILHMPKDKT